MAARKSAFSALPTIAQKIRVVGGRRTLLDSDLAVLYGVTTKAFNQAVRRNLERFPSDFLLVLSNQDVAGLRSQIVTLKTGRGQHRKYRQLAFTEHGAVMAATVLNSPQAVEMSVYVVRAFVELRTGLAVNSVLARKLDAVVKLILIKCLNQAVY